MIQAAVAEATWRHRAADEDAMRHTIVAVMEHLRETTRRLDQRIDGIDGATLARSAAVAVASSNAAAITGACTAALHRKAKAVGDAVLPDLIARALK
ncbi:hypothetical protein [uncultured Albimonas sp.]|uniref:hypothetical protein n=1 Tax=uncultured Albimonas sp. TaxID=1331701 RepID=UPI0030ED7B22|tara:strand:- start:5533 stop:5823 length:291 start_codon:yes stop_codon:yes gene_type:complete